MTGIERLRDVACKETVMLTTILLEIADQIERETLPRPLFEDGEPAQWGEKFPEQPDSWEKLEEDIKKSECDYFGHEGLPCHANGICRAYSSDETCSECMQLDIVRRAKRLAGVE